MSRHVCARMRDGRVGLRFEHGPGRAATGEPRGQGPAQRRAIQREAFEGMLFVRCGKFGWAKRNPKPRSMRDGDFLVGWGMATATYPAHKMEAAAKVQLRADGSATVQCAAHDLGTGAYTALTEISSEQLGVP